MAIKAVMFALRVSTLKRKLKRLLLHRTLGAKSLAAVLLIDIMCYSSLDPEGYPGTQEYQDWQEERSRRAWLDRLAYMEEVDEMNLMFPYN